MPLTLNGTTGITFPNGSAGTPALTGTDTDTGIVFGTNSIALSTDSVQKLLIDSSGNVGIGSTITANHAAYGRLSVFYSTPSSTGNVSQPIYASFDGSTRTFQLNHTGSSYNYAGVGGNELWYYSATYDAMTFGSDGNSNIKFVSGGSERVRINTSGNVGINTTSPVGNLDINIQGNRLGGNILLGTKSSGIIKWGSIAATQFDSANESEGYCLIHGASGNGNNIVNIGGGLDELNTATQISFYTATNTTTRTGTEKFKVDSSGNATILNGNLVIGTSGKGIDFSATANGSGTMTSELLSDYEEGTWTPTIFSGGTGSFYNTQNGGYVRVGNLVYASLDINPTGWTANGNHLRFGGLPFASAVSTNLTFGGAFVNYGNMIDQNTISNCQFHISWNGNTTVEVYNNTSSVAGTASGININGRIILCVVYRTS